MLTCLPLEFSLESRVPFPNHISWSVFHLGKIYTKKSWEKENVIIVLLLLKNPRIFCVIFFSLPDRSFLLLSLLIPLSPFGEKRYFLPNDKKICCHSHSLWCFMFVWESYSSDFGKNILAYVEKQQLLKLYLSGLSFISLIIISFTLINILHGWFNIRA